VAKLRRNGRELTMNGAFVGILARSPKGVPAAIVCGAARSGICDHGKSLRHRLLLQQCGPLDRQPWLAAGDEPLHEPPSAFHLRCSAGTTQAPHSQVSQSKPLSCSRLAAGSIAGHGFGDARAKALQRQRAGALW